MRWRRARRNTPANPCSTRSYPAWTLSWRAWRWLEFATNFRRLDRRMHNQSMIADHQRTVVSERNIGNGYFSAVVAIRSPALEETVACEDHRFDIRGHQGA